MSFHEDALFEFSTRVSDPVLDGILEELALLGLLTEKLNIAQLKVVSIRAKKEMFDKIRDKQFMDGLTKTLMDELH